jgi:glycosyltransferase involved in cell wall biosynthesis|tara:strand:+ start:9237 stop:10160 length:924 start_codon:yes stop_codon:yes gene_type:complete
MNICYVAHRYYPYPGGTEYYVKNLAEETLAQGHDVTVLAAQNYGDQNGVRVTGDLNILINEKFDLVVVHGSGVAMQDSVLLNARQIPSPIMFMIIRPEESKQIFPAMENSDYIACSTPTDWRFVQKYRQDHKSVQVNHSISRFDKPLNSEKHNPYGEPYAVSVGGFWSHKGHKELSEGWTSKKKLVMTGYHKDPQWVPKLKVNQHVEFLEHKDQVLEKIAAAEILILNSIYEGFGLVLLEAMWNGVPWASTPIAGAEVLKDHGFVYNNLDELMDYIDAGEYIKGDKEFIENNHLTDTTVKQIVGAVQ